MAEVISVLHEGESTVFETIQAGFTAAVDGDTLTLLDNASTEPIIVTKKLVFDLAGKELTAASGSAVFSIQVGGDLTVKDSSDEGTGAIINANQSGVYLSNTSDMTRRPVFTLESGMIQAQEFGICTFGGGVINILGGTIIAKDNGAVGSNGSAKYAEYPYEINISGGNIFANTESAGYANCGIYHANAGTVNISGGNIVSTAGAGVVVRGGSLNVSGGTISGQGDSEGLRMGDANPTYCGGIEICNAANYPGKMGTCLISGGKVSSVHNYGLLVIGDPADPAYPNAAASKGVISGGTIEGDRGGIGYITKTGEAIEESTSANVVVFGGSFNSDVTSFIDSSVNMSKEVDAEGNVHYVIKDGMKAVIAYLDDLLDHGDAHDAETLAQLKQILESISEVSEKAEASIESIDNVASKLDTSNEALSGIETDLSEAKAKISDILDGVNEEISQIGSIKESVDNVESANQGLADSATSMDAKLSELKTLNEQIKDLQKATVEELAKIYGDDPDEILPDDSKYEDAEIVSIKALIANAKKTGQSSAIWQHPMTDKVRKFLDENGYKCAAIPTVNIGNQWLITISE